MKTSLKCDVKSRLEEELERLRKLTGIGEELRVNWLPGTIKYRNGRILAEEVVGDTIHIYVENEEEALRLVRHGFVEWLLNQHTKRYRMLINKFIELFEEIQYWEKERLVQALERLLEK